MSIRKQNMTESKIHMDAIETFSEDELDYEYQDDEINSVANLKSEKCEDDNVRIASTTVVNSSRQRSSGGYVDLDDITSSGRQTTGRKSIHERVKITAVRRSGGRSDSQDESDVKSKDYELFDSLDVHPDDTSLRKASVYVMGVDKLSEYDVMRIFAEYCPESVQFVDESSCTVRWLNEVDVAKMLLGMTKPLRRVRGPRKPEDGELLESDEEGEEVGQVKEENGEDVAVVQNVGRVKKRKRSAAAGDDFVEVNIEEVKLPAGKWRVVTQHVPDSRLIIARFATGFDIRRGVINTRNRPRQSIAADAKMASGEDDSDNNYGQTWKTGGIRVRPGLNVFDEKGRELDWDYEHDTRFFAASDLSDGERTAADNDDDESVQSKRKKANNYNTESDEHSILKQPQTSELVVGNVQIRSRGRGAKKFLAALDFDHSGIEAAERTDRSPPVASASLASDQVVANRPLRSLHPNDKTSEMWSKEKAGSDCDELADYEDVELDDLPNVAPASVETPE